MEHTKGPWKVQPGAYKRRMYVWTDSFGYPNEVCVAAVTEGMYIGDQECNASLIAAAPELLAALEQANVVLIDLEREGYPVRLVREDCERALAKAKGK